MRLCWDSQPEGQIHSATLQAWGAVAVAVACPLQTSSLATGCASPAGRTTLQAATNASAVELGSPEQGQLRTSQLDVDFLEAACRPEQLPILVPRLQAALLANLKVCQAPRLLSFAPEVGLDSDDLGDVEGNMGARQGWARDCQPFALS